MLWITDSSKQVAQGQAQSGFDFSMHQGLVDLPNPEKQTQRAAKMERQRNKPQMKEQDNSSKDLDEIEESNLSERLE